MWQWLLSTFKTEYLEDLDSWDLEQETTPLDPITFYTIPKHEYVIQEETRTVYGVWEYCVYCKDWNYLAADPQPLPDALDVLPWCPAGYFIMEQHLCPHPDVRLEWELEGKATCIWCGLETDPNNVDSIHSNRRITCRTSE